MNAMMSHDDDCHKKMRGFHQLAKIKVERHLYPYLAVTPQI